MFKTVSVIALVLGAASPALAADFAGPRAEARLGWDRTTLKVSYDDGFSSVDGKGHDDGFGLGAELGYDVKLGTTAVAGAYAGAEWASTKECTELYGNDEACLKLGRNFTLGARIGAAVSPKALLYVKGGYSNGQLKATYEDFADSSYNYTDKANRGGFHVGVGAEMNVTDTGYVKLEAVRTNYKDYGTSDGTVSGQLEPRRTQIVAGFGLRF